jgi:hypothetical protein
MSKLVWRVNLVAEQRPCVMTETEMARIERDEHAGVAELGLRLAETKQLAAALQPQIVPAQVALLHGSTSRLQQPPPHLNPTRCGRRSGVQAPASGSGPGQRRGPPRPSDGRPCESAARRRSPACSARRRPPPGCAGCSPTASATRSGRSRPCTGDGGHAGWAVSQRLTRSGARTNYRISSDD